MICKACADQKHDSCEGCMCQHAEQSLIDWSKVDGIIEDCNPIPDYSRECGDD